MPGSPPTPRPPLIRRLSGRLARLCLGAALLAQGARADVTGLLVWHPTPDGLPMLLPALEGEAPEATARRYIGKLSSNADYMRLWGSQPPAWDAARFRPFDPAADETAFGLIANRPGHMDPRDPYFKVARESLVQAGASTYIVPLGLETALSPPDLAQFHSELSRRLPALVALGGADLAPELYGKPNTHSRDFLAARDRVEHALVKKYTSSRDGTFYGFCRGHQLCAVAHGFGLHQDLEAEGVAPASGHAKSAAAAKDSSSRSAWHEIELTGMDNLLFEATGKTRLEVNSRHHQAVDPSTAPAGSRLKVIAVEGGRVIEAIELEGRAGATFQFHPEDMGTDDSRDILRRLVSHARGRWAKVQGDCLRRALERL